MKSLLVAGGAAVALFIAPAMAAPHEASLIGSLERRKGSSYPEVDHQDTPAPPPACFNQGPGYNLDTLEEVAYDFCGAIEGWKFSVARNISATAVWKKDNTYDAFHYPAPVPETIFFQVGITPGETCQAAGDGVTGVKLPKFSKLRSCEEGMEAVLNDCNTDTTTSKQGGQLQVTGGDWGNDCLYYTLDPNYQSSTTNTYYTYHGENDFDVTKQMNSQKN